MPISSSLLAINPYLKAAGRMRPVTDAAQSGPSEQESHSTSSEVDAQTSGGSTTSDSASQVAKNVNGSSMIAALALRAQYAIDVPKPARRRGKKLVKADLDEPLVDKTAALSLHSKKTERLQKRLQRKSQKAASHSKTASLVDLPSELLSEVLSYLRPSDIYRLLRTSHNIRDYVLDNEDAIGRDVIRLRYWTLFRCFPLPVALKDVPAEAHPALLSERRQELMNIHRKSYHQHVLPVDPHTVCTCMTCVLAWNNLCLIVDLHHWQRNLEQREPIPMIARGSNPCWNRDLLQRNATIVRQAMISTLVYAWILEKHLATITGTILRFSRWKKKGETGVRPRPYRMTDGDVLSGTDLFLERSGPPCYDFPFHRDNYYTIEAYVPNRKWGTENKRWYYYALPPTQHERDLEWVKSSHRPIKLDEKTQVDEKSQLSEKIDGCRRQ